MRRLMLPVVLFALVALLPSAATVAAQDSPSQEAKPLPSIADKTAGMEKKDGFVPVYWDAKTGKIFLEIGRFETEFLYYVSLPAGMDRTTSV